MSGPWGSSKGWGDGSGGRGSGAMPATPTAGLDQDVVNSMLSRTGGHTPQKAAVTGSHPAKAPGGAWATPSPFAAKEAPTLSAAHTGAAMGTPSAPSPSEPLYDVYVVLDFEATCIRDGRIENQEVIEFPVVLVDARTLTVVAEFQRYVRPIKTPTLSDYCTELTGIQQGQVDAAETFPSVLAQVKAFLSDAGLGDAPPCRSYCFVTCGDWDLKTMLPAQLRISGELGLPPSFQRWCNLKKFMQLANPPLSTGDSSQSRGRGRGARRDRGVRITGMPEMLSVLGLSLEGRHHSGIDDCRNIARVLCALLHRGYRVHATTDQSGGQLGSWLAPSDAQWVPLTQLSSSLAATGAAVPDSRAVPQNTRGDVPASQPGSGGPSKKGRKEKNVAAASTSGAGAAPPRLPPLTIDATRDPVKDILANAGRTATLESEPWRVKTVSRSLSHLLRHGADERKLAITVNGYARVDAVLAEATIRKLKVTLEDMARVVVENDKQRFRIVYGAEDGHMYMAASQGHSLPGVMPDLTRITTVEACPQALHGTYWSAWKLIQESGYLSPMTRTHIHFAKGLPKDESVISGMRKSVELVLYLDVAAALRDGVELYESANGVILTAGVGATRQLPLKYIAKVIDQKTKKPVEW